MALLDLDELVGNMGGALRWLDSTEPEPHEPEWFTHGYHNSFFDDSQEGIKQPLIRLIKAYGLPPVREIAAIRDMVQAWRAAGVYVAFISSALAGAELYHIDFIAKHFPRACDGIFITSGHYKVANKGLAAREIVELVDAEQNTPIVHLDDLAHNLANVRNGLAGYDIASFQHKFATGTHFGVDPGATHGATPLTTFEAANQHLEQRLGRVLHVPMIYFLQALAERAVQVAEQDARLSVS